MKSLMLCLLLSFQLVAHEGHDHSPGRKDAPHGGVVKESKDYHFELVSTDTDIMIFPYDVDMKPIKELSSIKIEAHTKKPRQDKNPLKFEVMGNHWHAKFDKGDSHRYNVYLTLVGNDKKEELEWVID